MTIHRIRNRWLVVLGALALVVTLMPALAGPSEAADPSSGTLTAPAESGTVSVTWTGGPYTTTAPDPLVCVHSAVNCDEFVVTIDAPADYWDTRQGGVEVRIDWESASDDFDLYVYDSSGAYMDSSTSGSTNQEVLQFDAMEPGVYTIQVVAWLVTDASYSGAVTLTSTTVTDAMDYTEDRDTVRDLLTVTYPLNVVFVGYEPTAEEVAELREWVPGAYQPTVASLSPPGDEIHNYGAGLLNWNKDHLITSVPFFIGIRYEFDLRIVQASDAYAEALFAVAEQHTAPDYEFQSSADGEDLARYDARYGHFRVLAKGGDPAYEVVDATKADLIDAFAVEDWIFDTRHDAEWECAFTDLETSECLSPAIIQPQQDAYHDPYYDAYGLNLDHMPQGNNKGSSFFMFDTFSPDYAADYFRPNAYHVWGTDKVIDGQVIPAPVEEGGSWRITDPDTGDWDGVDYGRTWGGRYRFHFVDLGAAPNNFESASWLRAERGMSSDYPYGDPPIWQYTADPQWQQTTDECAADPQTADYTGGTPCRLMPRIGRSVGYGLFFRSTAGYLYRPIPRADVNWLATSTWTDFYSRPQWVEDPLGNQTLTSAPWYGTWWTDTEKLYQVSAPGSGDDDVLRWLSSALPYTRWVGRPGEVIDLYDPETNLPTGEVLDTSPRFEDLPAPKYHFESSATGTALVPEPLYPGDDNHVTVTYGDTVVNLTEVSNAIEKAKAYGFIGASNDFSVSDTYMRDYIDANREGIADVVPGINTIPSINMVFEKVYTWALPLIVGGIAVQTNDGEAWGVMNNVNDRFKWSGAHYPEVQPGDEPGSKRSVTGVSTSTQDNGTGFSYTVEHEAAHNLGLSHPHDGSYGVDKCSEGPNAGEWECYWSGLGWMYDISAAPTTYAMAYRPYEVEDQDNLQRGRVAEYLVAAQDALRERLVEEARQGGTEPSAAWNADYARMSEWRTMAATLFGCGDYLHSEYAARNAALAGRGVPQTAANTSEPRLLEAGQVFYFTVTPQEPCGPYGTNEAPVAVAVADPTTVAVGGTVSFDGTGSYDDHTPSAELGYEWDFDGDGTTDATTATATFEYGTAGTYTATLTVTDGLGLTGSDAVTITVGDDGGTGGGGGGKVTGGGYLYADDGSRRINFGFNAKDESGLKGNLQLSDKDQGVKIKLKDVTSLTPAGDDCGGIAASDHSARFTGTGTFNGTDASFVVCVEDSGEGPNGAGDQFVLFCESGCSYSTLDRGDSLIDGGNIQVHEAPTAPESADPAPAEGGAAAPNEPSAENGSAGVVIVDPVTLTSAPAGTTKLDVIVFDTAGERLEGATVTLTVMAGGIETILTTVTGVTGRVGVDVPVILGETEVTATVGQVSSNVVEISGG